MQSPRSTRPAKNKRLSANLRFARRAMFSFVAVIFFAAVLVAAAVSEANEAAKPGEAAKSSLLIEKPPCRWSEHESRLASYMSRIRSLEKEISDMISAKHHLDNSEKLRVVTQQISFKHSDLAKVVREYEEERLHIRFQHPDRDLDGGRRYTAQHLKSVEEIGQAFGLDGRLDRIRNQIQVVFPVSEELKKVEVRKPASVRTDDGDEMPTGLHLVK